MRTSITARARSATTFDRVPPSMTPTLTVTPRSASFSASIARIWRAISRIALAPAPGFAPACDGHAVRDELELADALARGLHRTARQRRFEHEHRVVLSRASRSIAARDVALPTSSSVVASSVTRGRAPSAGSPAATTRAGRDPNRQARLHVEHARPVQPAVAFLDRHAGDLADRPHRVEVPDSSTPGPRPGHSART